MKKTMKLIVLMIIMVLAVVTLTGCTANLTGAKDNTNDLEGLAVYTVDEDMTGYTKCEAIEGVEFYYPSNYLSVGKEDQPLYMDPEIRGASVNLVTEDFSSAFSFEGYIDASVVEVKDQMDVEGDVNKEFINLNGVKAAKLEYTVTAQGHKMKLTQIALKKDSKAYVLTVCLLADDAEELQPKLEKIIKSFK